MILSLVSTYWTHHNCERIHFVLEPESEPEVAQVLTKRKSPASEQIMPASKRRKTPCPNGTFNLTTSRDRHTVRPTTDESETEPESDIDLPTFSKVSKQLPPNTAKLPSDSETEPEDEDEIEAYLNPVKPSLILRSSSTEQI
jgi:hypothetical protein